MAAPIVAHLRFLLQNNLSCRRLFTELNSVQTRPKLSAGIRHFHTTETAHCTQEDRVSRIPVEKLSVSYSRSGGAGGQHVNKVSTKAEVRFHVETADWIPQAVRREILLKNHTRINKAGELIVTSEISRSQRRNLQDCLQKIWGIITEASRRPEEPTEEDINLRQQRLEKRNLERLKQKKIHSTTKQARRVDFD